MTFGRLDKLDVAGCVALIVVFGIASAPTVGWLAVILGWAALAIQVVRA